MALGIPASLIVSVVPSVLAAGGNALDLNGLLLTSDSRVPVGNVLSFPTLPAVAGFFGALSPEAGAAAIYFSGFKSAHKRPGALLFSQYNIAPLSAFVRSSPLGYTLTDLRTLSGTLSVLADGTVATGAVNLSGATSFSAAALVIGAALGLACTWDAQQGAFTIRSGTAGVASTIAFPTGVMADLLGLTQVGGGTLSQGADSATPVAAMTAIAATTLNWALFTTLFEPNLADKLAFAAWTNSQNGNYGYVPWDTDRSAAQIGAAACFGVLAGRRGANYNGVAPIYQALAHAVFVLGWAASLDFGQHNGRNTAAFRSQPGLLPSVIDATSDAALVANGYNFVGTFNTANDAFTFLSPGQVSGPFLWLDSYVNGIWMSNAIQVANMVLLTNQGVIPYDEFGYSLIRAASRDVIDQAINFGAIRAGVTLSQAQAAEVNAAAGVDIANTLTSVGWYYQVLDPAPEVRQARGTPQCTLWFTDGQSVQRLNIATVSLL